MVLDSTKTESTIFGPLNFLISSNRSEKAKDSDDIPPLPVTFTGVTTPGRFNAEERTASSPCDDIYSENDPKLFIRTTIEKLKILLFSNSTIAQLLILVKTYKQVMTII